MFRSKNMLGAIIGDLAGTKYEYQEFIDWKNGVINLERRKKYWI